MTTRSILYVPLFFVIFSSCRKDDTLSPIFTLNTDPESSHFRTEPFTDPGAVAADDYSCNLTGNIETINEVDINHYGTYNIIYKVEDEAGNSAEISRQIDIILPITDYYSQTYNAYDTCTSSNFFYTGLVQDCDCSDFSVIVGNISNFGPNATFTLPISGQYNHIITLDTTKAAVYFLGTGTMSTAADTLYWEYTIQDSISTDACRSVWIKE
ncbi:MAG: immunoglobulin-like domain-containing protein [Chitinophagales bacterium]